MWGLKQEGFFFDMTELFAENSTENKKDERLYHCAK
jgi:hypothetical protein